MKKINRILLIDDDEATNYLHQILIENAAICNEIIVKNSALDAIQYLKQTESPIPNLIFLDINMPQMNGWEFLDAYTNLKVFNPSKIVIIMLSATINPVDQKKADTIITVNDFICKPLSVNILKNIKTRYFNSLS